MEMKNVEILKQVEAKKSAVWQGSNYEQISELTGQEPEYKNKDKRTKALLIELEDQDEPHVLLINEKVYIDMNDVLCIADKETVVAINAEHVPNKNAEADIKSVEENNAIVKNEESIIDEDKTKTPEKDEEKPAPTPPAPEPFPVPEGYTQKQFPDVSSYYHTKSKTSAGLHSQIKFFSIDRKRWFNGNGTYYTACVYCFKKIEVDVGNERFTKEITSEE